MAVQWLSHQTGLVVLAGCSGGLQKEGRGRKIKERGEEKSGICGYKDGCWEKDQRSNR